MKTGAIERSIKMVEEGVFHLDKTHPETAIKASAELKAIETAIAEKDEALRSWEEREAACCPEDYGFEEVIAARTKRIKALETANAVKDELIYRIPRYLRTLRNDRPVFDTDDPSEVVGHWQTKDWLVGLIEIAEECEDLSSELTGKVLIGIAELWKKHDEWAHGCPSGIPASSYYCSLIDDVLGWLDDKIKQAKKPQ